uniref:(northern house mosquito) hypothetical protein n=1 Tax=Culex pipiens TaxID=7175 RepID=A0A8D8HGQ3_CULPI
MKLTTTTFICKDGAVLVFKECKQKIHGSDPFKVNFFFAFSIKCNSIFSINADYCPGFEMMSCSNEIDRSEYPKISSRRPGPNMTWPGWHLNSLKRLAFEWIILTFWRFCEP